MSPGLDKFEMVVFDRRPKNYAASIHKGFSIACIFTELEDALGQNTFRFDEKILSGAITTTD